MSSSAARASTASAAAVPAAFVLANAVSYALLLVAAHIMSSDDYGTLSSLLGLLLISTIPMLALQTVTARRAATEAGTAGLVRGTALVGSAAAAALLALSPALASFLHLSSVLGIVIVAATIPANAVLGTAMGVAQGRRRFTTLALLILMATGGRSVGGLAGLLLGRTPNSTLVGVLLGTAGAALAVTAVGRGFTRHRTAIGDRSKLGVLKETLHAGHVLGTFLLLTSLDVLLARHSLSSDDAGTYAVGSVVTRAAVWLPQSIISLMFASLSEADRHRETARRAAGAVLALGVCIVSGTAVLGPIMVSIVGGSKYHDLDSSVWLYALLGSLLSILQLAVLAGLAQRRSRRVWLLWLTIAVDGSVVLLSGGNATPTRLVSTLVIITAGAALVALGLTLRQHPPADDQLVAPDGQGAGV